MCLCKLTVLNKLFEEAVVRKNLYGKIVPLVPVNF
jgi:hypothetical protein